jgi:macrodomain Ter protein organizer (MatP/YcbG family)
MCTEHFRIILNDNNAPQNIPAMQRIPKDEQGNPLYEQADSDTAWDAIVEQTEGDEDMAQTVADGMVADKEEALKKLEKAKSKGGNSIAEKIASEKERKAAIDAAKQELLVWQKIAGTAKRRKMEADDERRRIADEAAALRKAEEEKLRAEREEAERIEREALNGVPDMVDDKPQDARARGYRRMNGHKIDRQEPVQALQGKEVSVKFSDDAIVGGRVAVIDVNLLQPSHIQGVRNPLHFIDEAQPKERNDEASVLSARKIAGNIRPEEITSSVTAYTGAPTVNARGEAIQGNNRSDALRIMWENHPEQAALYKQYLKDHAEEFGLQAEDIEAMEHPVLVNMVDVDDAEAIRLGQYVAQDTESGGVERIKPKNALQRMGAEMRSFANLLLRTSDDEMSFAGLVDSNGANVLKWMSQRGFFLCHCNSIG